MTARNVRLCLAVALGLTCKTPEAPTELWPQDAVLTTGGIQLATEPVSVLRRGDPVGVILAASNPSGPLGRISFKSCAWGLEIYADTSRGNAPVWTSRGLPCDSQSGGLVDAPIPVGAPMPLRASSTAFYPSLPIPPRPWHFVLVIRHNGRLRRMHAGVVTI